MYACGLSSPQGKIDFDAILIVVGSKNKNLFSLGSRSSTHTAHGQTKVTCRFL
jgi:hypothetical protein